ncbi:MAG: hypothetical protein Harvfovirus40_16 [Harvfovirus sp.]|uniref:Uncharacterized protein n=1 Tax=Harvfovirus sp. TaxID=2487768 RepID=A0A3G5A6T0_9VIRU|nr:MAG: hypothetical protein Harvfovirus40_16 [Harvfovirus sp.]
MDLKPAHDIFVGNKLKTLIHSVFYTEFTFFKAYSGLSEEKKYVPHSSTPLATLRISKGIPTIHFISTQDKFILPMLENLVKELTPSKDDDTEEKTVSVATSNFETWENEWREKEVMENNYGSIRMLKFNFHAQYKKLSPSGRANVDYFARVMKIIIYIAQVSRPSIKDSYSIDDVYDLGPNPYYTVAKSNNMLGLNCTYGSCTLMTAMGKITLKYPYWKNKKRDSIILSRLQAVVISPETYSKQTGFDGPYFSLMRDIDSTEFDSFEYLPTPYTQKFDDIRLFWQKNCDLILFKLMASIKEKPINTAVRK